MVPSPAQGIDLRTEAPRSRGEPLGLYRRIAAHERGLWVATLAVGAAVALGFLAVFLLPEYHDIEQLTVRTASLRSSKRTLSSS